MKFRTTQSIKNLTLILATFSLVILATACGGSDSPQPEATSSSGEAQTAVPADTPKTEQPVSAGDSEAAQKHIDAAEQLIETEKFDEAIAELDQAIEFDPTNADAYTLRGKAHISMKNYKQAIPDFTQAIELDPNQDEAYFNRAISLTRTGGMSALQAVMADFGMVLKVSENPELRREAQAWLEQVLQSSDDPALREMIMAALEFADGDLTRDFEGKYITLTHPVDWSSVDPSQQAFCQQHGTECLMALLQPSDGTNINVMRIGLPQKVSAVEFDEKAWEEFIAGTPEATLQSRVETEIGGEAAIERIFSLPAPSVPGGQVYIKQLYAAHDSAIFQFTVWTPGATAFEQHTQEIEAILGSVQFMAESAAGSSPESVLQTIFDAAQSGDFDALADICDPLGENDEDTQAICDLATDDTNRDSFFEFFQNGKVNGQAILHDSGNAAQVPFLFGPEGDREETMDLIKREGQWYLLGF